jgi:hypothetical protein
VAFIDTFTVTTATDLEAHTPDTGTGWTNVSASAGALFCHASTDTIRTLAGLTDGVYAPDDPGSANHYIQCNIGPVTVTPPNIICVRMVDKNNWVGFGRTGALSGQSALYKNVAGTITSVATFTHLANALVRLEANADDIEVLIDGVSQGVSTISDHNTETSVGLYVRTHSGTLNWIDNWESGPLSGSTPSNAPQRFSLLGVG